MCCWPLGDGFALCLPVSKNHGAVQSYNLPEISGQGGQQDTPHLPVQASIGVGLRAQAQSRDVDPSWGWRL